MQGVTKDTTQYIKNKSFDPTFQVSMVEAVGYDGSVLRPIAVDASGNLKIDPTNLDARYLKLDCSNDPLTDDLTITSGKKLILDG